jgi:DNA repair exonuclease SbcCD nuclease subunit
MAIFLHTADWHLGKSFYRFSADGEVQGRLREERLRAVERLGALAGEVRAAAVLVAGDVFHTPQVEERLLAAAMDRIGRIPCPVIAIPGNHDHGGPGSLWQREALKRLWRERAPNLRLVLEQPEAIAVGPADVIAAPVTQKMHVQALGNLGEVSTRPGAARIGLVHGAVHDFAEEPGTSRALLLAGAGAARLDYLALGDYHRQQRVEIEGLGCEAWYAGTPEPDGFPSHHGYGQRRGNCLLVSVEGPGRVSVEPRELSGGLEWERAAALLRDGQAVAELNAKLRALASGRVHSKLLSLDLEGSSLGYEDARELERCLDELAAQFLILERRGRVALEPSPAELHGLTHLPGIAGLAAQRLYAQVAAGGEQADCARLALARLFALSAGGQP